MGSRQRKMHVLAGMALTLLCGMWMSQAAMGQAATSDHAKIVRAAAKVEKLPDKALYLNALAFFHDKKYERTIQLADDLIAEHKDSAWLRKARFLKAKALIQRREFKAAEAIYEEEAHRLLSETRKQEIAGVFVEFADALVTKPKPDDIGAPPPNYAKAAKLYAKALRLEIGRDLRDEIMFKRARTIQLARKHRQAINYYREYLREFDPGWSGNVDSASRMARTKREKPVPAGRHILEVRLHLGEAQVDAGDHKHARVTLKDLLALVASKGVDQGPDEQFIARTRWLLVRTYPLPQPGKAELDRTVGAVRTQTTATSTAAKMMAASL